MNGKLNDKEAQCPFFLRHTKSSITCESVMGDAIANIYFGNMEEKKTIYKKYCCDGYKHCKRYMYIMEKYGD